uniref:Uncharacterized protein n=1 Tax=Anguilla anguilla TaxID=7936 RepID=A0A0E9W5Q9_ANGAN
MQVPVPDWVAGKQIDIVTYVCCEDGNLMVNVTKVC